MRKILFLFLFSLTFLLKSCIVNSNIIYHADAATTTEMNMDLREFIINLNEMMPDSLQSKNNKNPLKELGKLPKSWTSMYDIYSKEGKEISKHPDTIRLYKKMFMKSYEQNGETIGLSIKMDHFTQQDMKMIDSKKGKTDAILSDSKKFGEWNGKKLVIDTKEMNLDSFRSSMPNENGKEDTMSPEEEENFMKMMNIRFTNNLKFENKIKSIVGKHDWIKQLDDYTVQIYFDSQMIYDKSNKMKNQDKTIIIETE